MINHCLHNGSVQKLTCELLREGRLAEREATGEMDHECIGLFNLGLIHPFKPTANT